MALSGINLTGAPWRFFRLQGALSIRSASLPGFEGPHLGEGAFGVSRRTVSGRHNSYSFASVTSFFSLLAGPDRQFCEQFTVRGFAECIASVAQYLKP